MFKMQKTQTRYLEAEQEINVTFLAMMEYIEEEKSYASNRKRSLVQNRK